MPAITKIFHTDRVQFCLDGEAPLSPQVEAHELHPQTGSATLTGRFPGIWGSPAQRYLKNSSDYDPDLGYYYYDMKYCHDLDFYVEGVSFGQNKADLSFDDLTHSFLPVSEGYADVAVDERTLVIEPKITGAQSSDDTLSFDVLVRDPVAAYAEDPAAFPIKAELNNVAIPSADITYLAGYELPGTYKISLKKKPIKCGVNEFHFKIVSSAGIITRFTYAVEIGDEDKLSPDCPLNQELVCNPTPGCVTYTKNDRYIISHNSTIQAIGAPEFHPLYIFGEFNNVRSKTITTGAGVISSSITLNRISRFGRFMRPFLVIDDYPAEGAISVPSGSGGAPIAVQKPGGIVRWTVGSQSASTYVEGVSIIWNNRPTHLLPGPVDPPQTFSFEAYVSNERDAGAEKKFSVQLFSAAGAPVELGTGVGEILLNAQDQVAAFGGKGKKYGFAGPIEIVRSLPNGARWSDTGGSYKIVPELGGYVAVRFAGLRTRAVGPKAEFIDEEPNYSLKYDHSYPESDNFFLRENDASGNPDSEKLDIYYKILPSGVEVSDVKIKIYKGTSATPDWTLDGEQDAAGGYKTGDDLNVQWDAPTSLADTDEGFYRCQLQVFVGGSSTPLCETSIDDADSTLLGWQCPDDCLAIQDLIWKHRPSIRIHVSEDGYPVKPDHFMVASYLMSLTPVAELVQNPGWSDLASNDETDNYLDVYGDGEVSSAKLPSTDKSVIYISNRATANYVFLQYYMFENFSASPINKSGVYHEGDLEYCQVAVRLKKDSDASNHVFWVAPFGMMAGQHYYGQTLKWDMTDGSAPSSAQSQEHVEHDNNKRPTVYIAHGAHATYFAQGSFKTVLANMGTQIQYDWPVGVTDVTGNIGLGLYTLLRLNSMPTFKAWQGRWGHTADLSSTKAGPAGPKLRDQKNSSGGEVIILHHPKVLHNSCVKTSQASEMTIP